MKMLQDWISIWRHCTPLVSPRAVSSVFVARCARGNCLQAGSWWRARVWTTRAAARSPSPPRPPQLQHPPPPLRRSYHTSESPGLSYPWSLSCHCCYHHHHAQCYHHPHCCFQYPTVKDNINTFKTKIWIIRDNFINVWHSANRPLIVQHQPWYNSLKPLQALCLWWTITTTRYCQTTWIRLS